jgi:hypothetical protein
LSLYVVKYKIRYYTLLGGKMAKGTITKKVVISTILKVLAVLLITALILCSAALSAIFVIARGPSGNASVRLAATLAESGSFFGPIFYTHAELDAAISYTAPKLSCADLENAKPTVVPSLTEISGDTWNGYMLKGIAPQNLRATTASAVSANATFSVGIDPMIDVFYTNGTLNYVGSDESIFCLCALNSEGVLFAGGSDIYTAVNSDFVWAIEADRVLVSGGEPMTNLGGGYACRAAIGQAADRSIIVIFAEGDGIYPSGITYDELAALMYEAGALTAAAIDTDESFIYEKNHITDKTTRNGLVIWSFVEGGTANE